MLNYRDAMKDSCLALRWGATFLLLAFFSSGKCCAQGYVHVESEAESRARLQIESALSRIGSIDCVDKPLQELADDLGRRMGVSIVLAKSALADAAITDDTPVTAQISGVTYRSLLRLVLGDLKLAWTFRNEVIVITTPEDAESMLETRLYPVLDLVAPGSKTDEEFDDYDTLIDTITTTVEPDSWDDVGGPGTIAEYPVVGALVISQTTEIHEQVEKLLASLRRVRSIQGIPALSISSPRSKRIKSAFWAAPSSRRYGSAAAETWQVPRVHGGE